MQQAAELRFAGTSRFEVLSQVGQGAAGFVYEVQDRERNVRLALKTLRTLSAEAILLLKAEFRSAQDLHHPNLVTLHELFEERGQWFFTMDYVPGRNFLTYVRYGPESERRSTRPRPLGAEAAPAAHSAGSFDEPRLRAALGQLAQGLSALHGAHKVHRDIKPSNVLVTPEGRVVILDFGIVSDVGQRHGLDEGIVGTAHYMAPEQAASEAVGPAADWYAVGTVLYQALTGRLPFSGMTHDVLAKKLAAEPPPPDTLIAGLPADLCALCAELLRTDPAKRPDGARVLERLGVRGEREYGGAALRATFVGRRDELRDIDAAFAETAAGRAVTVLVEGESGVGKSYLVREFTDRAVRDANALVFRGRCYERESVPYKAVDSVVDDLCRFLTLLPVDDAAALMPEHAGLLRRLFPVLDQVPAIADARITSIEAQNPQEARARVFAVLRELLANITARQRLVVIIDDLQWADADSFALLSDVLRPPDAPALLLLGTLRSGLDTRQPGARASSAFARLPGEVRYVQLAALPAADARALIEHLLDDGAADGAVESILAETKGHPLFIDELVRHRAAHGASATPTRLDDALWERAARLPGAARRLLEVVAIAGVPLPHDTLAQAAALDYGQLFALVSTLRAEHFVRTSGVCRADTVEPYHDRVRESVLAHVPDAARADWHARLALALEQAPGTDPELLVTHWHGAGNAARAAEYAVRGADQAATTLAFDHAAALYRLALELTAPTHDAGRALKVKLAGALTNAGRGADAARAYLDAAGADDASNAALDLRRRAAEEYLCSGHMDEGTATLDAVLAAAEVKTPKTPLAVVLALLFRTTLLALRGLRFSPRPAASVDPRELLRLDCLHSAGCGYGMTDHVRGKEFQLRTLLRALRAGEPSRVARALAFYAAGHVSAGVSAYAKTMKLHALVAKMARELAQPYLEGMAACVEAYAYQFTGQWRNASAAFVRAEETFRDRCVGVTYETNSVRTIHGRALATLGDVPELERRATEVLRDAEHRGDLYTTVNVRSTSMVFLALVRDDPEAAGRELELATRHLATRGFFVQHAFCLLSEAYVALYRGDAAAADALVAARWPTVKRSMLLHVQSLRILFADARARACLGVAAAGGAAGARAAREAGQHARALEREGTAWSLSLARLARAGLAHLRGRGDEALAHLAAAVEGFDAGDMPLHAAVARRRRGVLLGGDAGAALRATAEAWMAAHGVVSPARTAALYSPGFAREE